MLRRRGAALVLAVVGALIFGAVMAVLHGSEGGLRATIGNLSAPWLLVAFGAGALFDGRRVWLGALSGLIVTVIALCGFYVTNIWVLGIFGHGVAGDVWFALSTGRYYIRFGLLTGPIMGGFGALWRRKRPLAIGLAATGLLIFEPLAWVAYLQSGLPSYFVPVSIAEVGVGVVLSVALVVWRRRSIPA